MLAEHDDIEHAKRQEKEYCHRGSLFDDLGADKDPNAEDVRMWLYALRGFAITLDRRVHEVLESRLRTS
jgi:hypothetical protein